MAHVTECSETSTPLPFRFRQSVIGSDRIAVRRIIESTGFFRPDEADVAVELIDERLRKGEASGYHFLFADADRGPIGYACYGPIACTIGSFDLYWIAVDPSWQGKGIGQLLLDEVERQVRQREGRQVYIETSGRDQYAPTRGFYARCGYEVVAVLGDFYDRGDDKVIWRKALCTGGVRDGVGPG